MVLPCHLQYKENCSKIKRSVLKPRATRPSMEWRQSAVKSTLVVAGIYAALFVGHIFAAANNWDVLFRLIALTLTLITFLLGPCIAMLVSNNVDGQRKKAHRLGSWISAPLAVGLAFAYANQSFDFVLSIGFLCLTVMTHWVSFLRFK